MNTQLRTSIPLFDTSKIARAVLTGVLAIGMSVVGLSSAHAAFNINSNGGLATASVSVAENQTAVTTVTTLDEAATATFSLVGTDDDALFTISTGGVLTFISAPDFEARNDADLNGIYVVTVEASDGTTQVTQEISVTVTSEPTVTGSATPSVAENVTTVETYTASASVTWTLSGTDAADFAISSGGVLTFAAAPDYEAPADANTDNSYSSRCIFRTTSTRRSHRKAPIIFHY